MVHVPAVAANGELITADLVIGPASELLVIPADVAFAEPDTADAVKVLRDKTRALEDSRRPSYGAALPVSDDPADQPDEWGVEFS